MSLSDRCTMRNVSRFNDISDALLCTNELLDSPAVMVSTLRATSFEPSTSFLNCFFYFLTTARRQPVGLSISKSPFLSIMSVFLSLPSIPLSLRPTLSPKTDESFVKIEKQPIGPRKQKIYYNGLSAAYCALILV